MSVRIYLCECCVFIWFAHYDLSLSCLGLFELLCLFPSELSARFILVAPQGGSFSSLAFCLLHVAFLCVHLLIFFCCANILYILLFFKWTEACHFVQSWVRDVTALHVPSLGFEYIYSFWGLLHFSCTPASLSLSYLAQKQTDQHDLSHWTVG